MNSAKRVPQVTAALAGFAAGPLDLVGSAHRTARRTVLNTIALATGASQHEASRRALGAVSKFESPALATVLGAGARLGVTWAACLNGIAAHVEDFDDTHLRTVIHPGAPVVPAALAVAEWRHTSAAEFLEAVAVGIEITLRVGNGVCPSHFDRGWHVTATHGGLGAAVATGRLLKLDQDRMAMALGLAATQAAGLQEALGTMAKSFHAGKAAAIGVEAGLLAARGFTAAQAAIEGPKGFANLTSEEVNFDVMLEDLGQSWVMERNMIKRYACGIVSHPIIEAAIALRALIDPKDIKRVETRVNPIVFDVMGIAEPSSGLQSKFSMCHCVAVGLLDGLAGPDQFSDLKVSDQRVAVLRHLVSAKLDVSVAKDEAFMTVHMQDGRVLESHVEHAPDSDSPMSDAQLRSKVALVAGPVIGLKKANDLIEAVLGPYGMRPPREIVALTLPEAS